MDRVELLSRAAQAARFSGDPERAVALCREALELEREPARRAALYERLGEYHFWDDEIGAGLLRAGARAAARRAAAAGGQGPRADGPAALGESRACCEAALAAGAAPRITLGVVLAFLGEPDAGEAHLREALALSASGEETARAYLHLGELLRVRGDHAQALEAMVDGEREAARLGLRGSFGHFMYVNGADDLFRLGRWDEAAERLAEAATMDLSRTAGALRRATAGQLHVARGDLDAARRELEAADDDGLPAEFLAPLAAARGRRSRWPKGDLAAARAHVAGALGGVEDPFYTSPLYSLGLRVEAERAERDRAHRRRPAWPAPGSCWRRSTRWSRAPPRRTRTPTARSPAPSSRASRAGRRPRLARGGRGLRRARRAVPGRAARLHEAEASLIAQRRAGAGGAGAGSRARHRGTARGGIRCCEAVEALARRARLALADAPPPPRRPTTTAPA